MRTLNRTQNISDQSVSSRVERAARCLCWTDRPSACQGVLEIQHGSVHDSVQPWRALFSLHGRLGQVSTVFGYHVFRQAPCLIENRVGKRAVSVKDSVWSTFIEFKDVCNKRKMTHLANVRLGHDDGEDEPAISPETQLWQHGSPPLRPTSRRKTIRIGSIPTNGHEIRQDGPSSNAAKVEAIRSTADAPLKISCSVNSKAAGKGQNTRRKACLSRYASVAKSMVRLKAPTVETLPLTFSQ